MRRLTYDSLSWPTVTANMMKERQRMLRGSPWQIKGLGVSKRRQIERARREIRREEHRTAELSARAADYPTRHFAVVRRARWSESSEFLVTCLCLLFRFLG